MSETRTREEIVWDMLGHFHKDSIMYGGWPIFVKNVEEALIVNEEFKGVLKAKENKDRPSGFLVALVKGAEFSDKHTIQVLRDRAESYQREADKYYNGIKKLIGD